MIVGWRRSRGETISMAEACEERTPIGCGVRNTRSGHERLCARASPQLAVESLARATICASPSLVDK